MNPLEGAKCAGKWWLFDSTDILDHAEARQMCAACPVVAECRRVLSEASQIAYGGGKGGYLQGTWAGQLYGRVGQRRPDPVLQESA